MNAEPKQKTRALLEDYEILVAELEQIAVVEGVGPDG